MDASAFLPTDSFYIARLAHYRHPLVLPSTSFIPRRSKQDTGELPTAAETLLIVLAGVPLLVTLVAWITLKSK